MLKKTFLGVLFIVLILALLIAGISFKAAKVGVYGSSDTTVGGYVSENTTWTCEDSPYIVVDDVHVISGVFLTVEPGVTVKFTNGTNLIIDGDLFAQGNSTHKIIFTSNATTPALGDWGAINIRTSGSYKEVKWVTVEYSTFGIKGLTDSKITQTTFHRNEVGVNSSSLIVRESNFTENNIGVTGSDINISLCRFEESDRGINGEHMFVAGSRFVANNVGVYGSNLVVEESNFTGNSAGVTGSNINITLCRFEQNDNGVESSGSIRNSDFHNNTNGITTTYARIFDCRVTRNKATGITSNGEIRNTEVSHNGGDGIQGSGIGYEGPSIVNCLITNNNGTGVRCDEITNSTVSDNKGNGVNLQGSMVHCIISNNSGVGVYGLGTILDSQISHNLYGLKIGYLIFSGNGAVAGRFNVIRSHI